MVRSGYEHPGFAPDHVPQGIAAADRVIDGDYIADVEALAAAAELRIGMHCTGGEHQSFTCAACMPLRTALDRLAGSGK